MALFLVQHGISTAEDIDPEKGLSAQGRIETEQIAKVAKGYGIKVKKIVHSGKKRAAQTAAIYHNALSLETPLEIIPGIKPLDNVRAFARSINSEKDLMVIGHMPFMQRLVSYLTTGSDEIRVYQFQNSGIVCLDNGDGPDGEIDWFIKWTLNPHIS